IEIDRTRFQNRVAKFEDNSDTAQIVKRRSRIDFWIYDRNAFWNGRFRLMMIEHDYFNAAFPKIDNLRARRCPTVERDEKLRVNLLDTAMTAVMIEPVTFCYSRRPKQIRTATVTA